MKTESFFSERKQRWISRLYFHIAATPNCNLHPFKNMLEFLQARVGDLVWGKDETSRDLSKTKFSQALARVLDLYNVHISPSDVLRGLSNDALTNYDLVKRLALTGRLEE